jgi:AbrB family looped-hinge helix DNA binding protein
MITRGWDMNVIHATVTSKGQITIPLKVREDMDLKPGSRVLFHPHKNGYRIVEEIDPLDSLKGSLSHKGKPVSIEDMDNAIDGALREKWFGR